MINEKIKELRKQNNLTQEELADKLCVSRQAITKWESGLGTPDISNIDAIAKLFGITIDELLSSEKIGSRENISRTEFDIFAKDDFDLNFGFASSVDITLSNNEKVIVEIRTDLNDPAYKLAKVKLTNGKKMNNAVIDIQTDKKYNQTETNKPISDQESKKHLFIKVLLPRELAQKIELNGVINSLNIHDFDVDKHIEFDGKVEKVNIKNMKGYFELTSNIDMEIDYDGSLDRLDINQLSSISNLYINEEKKLNVVNEGRSCKLLFENYEIDPQSTRKIELNGRKSELTIWGRK